MAKLDRAVKYWYHMMKEDIDSRVTRLGDTS